MTEDRKLYVAFNWVIYMASSFQPPAEWFSTIDKSTGPLPDIFDRHPRIKSNFSVGGWVGRWLQGSPSVFGALNTPCQPAVTPEEQSMQLNSQISPTEIKRKAKGMSD